MLTRAVERHRLASDVPVGVLLSGGLDSSLLVGLLADHVDDLLTFSVGFEDVGEGAEKADEFEYSDQVVERFKTRHHKYLIPNAEVLKRLPEAVSSMAEPMVGQDAVAFYLLGERVADEVKVVLSGQGADEVFGGYFWYPRMDEATGSALDRFRHNYFDRDHAEYLETVAPAWHVPDVTAELVERELAKPKADTFLDQVLRFDATTLVVDDPVKRVDNMTMAWGLEARVPFLDHELVELAARMPPSLKLKEGGKFPLKAIARGIDSGCGDRPPQGLFPGAGAEIRARRFPRIHAQNPDVGRLHQTRPLPAPLCGKTAGRTGSPFHPHPGQQAVAPGAAGTVAATECGQRVSIPRHTWTPTFCQAFNR